ncbi:unnamed protein product [Vicia faba]|uniref:40S ribosomal protein SA n=1 Tax=Vicia faba TaxID=3906 RepID=A0AAV0ZKZ3_VICFA|nr:unnamed protein product [Vicia faba]
MATSAAGPRQLSQKEADIQMMLAADVHLGTKNCDFQMERYIFKRRNDGIYIINLGKTWEKLQLAARVIVAIENPQDIIVQSARPYGQRAVLKFAQYTGAHAIAGRHTPGTFTNQLQTSFSEPRLLILTDPRTDHQPIKEAALGNIPTIAFSLVVSFGFWLGWCYKCVGTIRPGLQWDVMVDLFFYREPEEAKEQEEDEVPVPDYAIADFNAGGPSDGQWPAAIEQQWPDAAPQPIPAVPAVNWTAPELQGEWGEAVPPPQQIPTPGIESVAATGWE